MQAEGTDLLVTVGTDWPAKVLADFPASVKTGFPLPSRLNWKAYKTSVLGWMLRTNLAVL
jgi:hypothetical protein